MKPPLSPSYAFQTRLVRTRHLGHKPGLVREGNLEAHSRNEQRAEPGDLLAVHPKAPPGSALDRGKGRVRAGCRRGSQPRELDVMPRAGPGTSVGPRRTVSVAVGPSRCASSLGPHSSMWACFAVLSACSVHPESVAMTPFAAPRSDRTPESLKTTSLSIRLAHALHSTMRRKLVSPSALSPTTSSSCDAPDRPAATTFVRTEYP